MIQWFGKKKCKNNCCCALILKIDVCLPFWHSQNLLIVTWHLSYDTTCYDPYFLWHILPCMTSSTFIGATFLPVGFTENKNRSKR